MPSFLDGSLIKQPASIELIVYESFFTAHWKAYEQPSVLEVRSWTCRLLLNLWALKNVLNSPSFGWFPQGFQLFSKIREKKMQAPGEKERHVLHKYAWISKVGSSSENRRWICSRTSTQLAGVCFKEKQREAARNSSKWPLAYQLLRVFRWDHKKWTDWSVVFSQEKPGKSKTKVMPPVLNALCNTNNRW